MNKRAKSFGYLLAAESCEFGQNGDDNGKNAKLKTTKAMVIVVKENWTGWRICASHRHVPSLIRIHCGLVSR